MEYFYLAALQPVWFHSDLESFPVEDRNQGQLELKDNTSWQVGLHLFETIRTRNIGLEDSPPEG